MPKASKPGYYAVRTGRAPGIYPSWPDCEAQIKGFAGALYKKFDTETEAIEFMSTKLSAARASTFRDSVPVPSTSQSTRPSGRPHSTTEDERDSDVVYCDGACKGNGQPGSIAGIGVWWGHGDPRNISERCPGDQTNNRAELIAIVRILETTPRLERRLLIKTDSNYSIQCVTSWIFNWTRNGFRTADGKPVKNRALIKYLAALLRVRRKTLQTIEFKHVRGHAGIEGNEAADQLANLGATKPVVSERDWGTLEKQVSQTIKPVEPVKRVDGDFEAYVNSNLNDDRLAEFANASNSNAALSVPEPRRQQPRGATHASASSIPTGILTGLIAPGPNGRSTLPSRFTELSASSQKSTITISKEELEMYASCLLDDDDLAAFGRDGVFDSDT